MAQFIAPNPDIEVSGAYVLSVAYASKRGVELRLSILEKHGIQQIREDTWYPWQPFLDAIKEMSEVLGDMNLFAMGKDAALKQEIPPVKNLREALELMNIANLLNHRLHGVPMFDPSTGALQEGAGSIQLTEYDEVQRRARIVFATPYASKNEEGWLTGFVERFRPNDSTSFEVKEDISQERKLTGGNSTTFIVQW